MTRTDVNLLDPELFQRGEHHEVFRRMRAEAPVSWHDHPDGRGFWNVARLDDLAEVNRDSSRFSSEAGGVSLLDPEELESLGRGGGGGDSRGVMMLTMDPPKHTRYRLLVNKGFTKRMIGLLEQYLRHRSTLIVDNIIERGSCDFVEDLASELPLQAIAEIMGVPQEDRMLLFRWSNALIGIDDPEYGGREQSMQASASLYQYVNALAGQRRSDPRDDIVTKLINAEVEGDRLTELEFDMFMLLLTVAGNETTRNTTAWGMYTLMQHPDQYRALCQRLDDDSYLSTAIEEILRWASPVLHFRRTALADTTVGGQAVARDDKVVMWFVSANRDEDHFRDPYTFDITRTPNDHVAFGAGGPHFCLGANLARMELRLIFREILSRIPDMRPAGDAQFLRSNFIGGIKHLPVAYQPGRRLAPEPVPA